MGDRQQYARHQPAGKKLVPETEYTPAVLLQDDDFEVSVLKDEVRNIIKADISYNMRSSNAGKDWSLYETIKKDMVPQILKLLRFVA